MNTLLAMSPAGSGVFVFLLGLLIVFFGMTVIVLVISLIGKIMKAKDSRKKAKPVEQIAEPVQESTVDEEEDKRIVAAIMAAITAVYAAEGNDCEFKVKRIKRV